MFTLLLLMALFVIVCAASIALSMFVWRRMPQRAKNLLAWGYREARVRSGNYDLRLVVEGMAQAVLDNSFDGVAHRYVPAEATFGMHPDDIAAFGGLLPLISEELANVVGDRVEHDGRLAFPDAVRRLEVNIHEDASATPGRPALRVGRSKSTRSLGSAQSAREPVLATELAATWLYGAELETVSMTGWALRSTHDASPESMVRASTLVGRAPEAVVRITNASVSRRHALLRACSEWVRLEDLGSANGTFLNGVRVRDVVEVKAGDRMRFGTSEEWELIRHATAA